MNAAVYSRYGKIVFALAMIAIGAVHVVSQNFPTGLEPAPLDIPARQLLVYVAGLGLMASGLMLFSDKLGKHASALAGVIWLILLGFLDFPAVAANLHSPAPWTRTAETLGILSGVLVIANKYAAVPGVFNMVARLFMAIGLGILAVQHYLYLTFIETLVPAWLPGHAFWAWVVLIGFILAAISILVGLKMRIATLALAVLFFTWVLILHLPRAIGAGSIEAEWTSTFVALAWGGAALLLAGTTKE